MSARNQEARLRGKDTRTFLNDVRRPSHFEVSGRPGYLAHGFRIDRKRRRSIRDFFEPWRGWQNRFFGMSPRLRLLVWRLRIESIPDHAEGHDKTNQREYG